LIVHAQRPTIPLPPCVHHGISSGDIEPRHQILHRIRHVESFHRLGEHLLQQVFGFFLITEAQLNPIEKPRPYLPVCPLQIRHIIPLDGELRFFV
jgi:hypothetical protein